MKVILQIDRVYINKLVKIAKATLHEKYKRWSCTTKMVSNSRNIDGDIVQKDYPFRTHDSRIGHCFFSVKGCELGMKYSSKLL